ncbi:efflux RND transporter periplasmic adaptor subunit [Pleurocapsales cyanobacterium LEGE 06147]|nr:efflux RND transporter periplasmic adaptor subunit [Pleurocapsales cyanobacterium LEGE 06147]
MKSEVRSELAPADQEKPRATIMPENRNKQRSGIKWLVWSGVVSLFAVGGWLGYSYYIQRSTEPITVRSLSVQKGTVEITASESGTVEYGGQRTLKSPGEDLTVEQVKVGEGDRVSAGETLILLRDRQAEEQEKDQIIENAKYELTLARNQQKIAEVQQRLEIKKAKVAKLRQPFQLGAIPESTFLEEQEQLNTTQAELMDARLELQTAELDLRKGQEKLQTIRQRLKDRTLASPIDGVVLNVQVKDGDGITTDTDLLTLGDPSQEIVKLRLTTLNAAKVQLNQIARVSAIGPNPEIFTGRVISLSPAATAQTDQKEGESSNPFAQSSDSQNKVDATVLLDKPSDSLIPGSQVNVEIILEQRQNVATLPIEAVQTTGTQPFVWVADSQDRAKKQPITPGLEGLELVEVTSGLKVGEQVILAPPDTALVPGTPLNVGEIGR